MAQIKLGGGVVGITGSIAGNTFARNRSGAYVRSRTMPVNRKTSLQQAVRTALSALTIMWYDTLNADQRTAWGTYAAAIPMKNRLGESHYLTGFNHFIRSNTELKNRGLTVVEKGPTVLALPEKDSKFAVTGSAATGNLSVVFDNTLAWAHEAGGHLLVYMGVPKKSTRNYFNGPWNYAGKVDGNATTAPTSPKTMAAPFTLVAGQKVWCKARIVRADGRLSESFRDDFIVSA